MAQNSIGGKLKIHTRMPGLKYMQKMSPVIFKHAMEKGVIQFLTWANTGSAKESRKPPIRWGVLRGSSSGFVGNELVTTYKQNIKPGAGEIPTPAESYDGKDLVATWAWNTDYATKMHETNYKGGTFTQQDGDAGNKWLERHLKKDKEALYKMIASEFKKEAGM